jgi:hypothetical protein
MMLYYLSSLEFLYLDFQAEGWIDDKLKVANEDNFKEVSDLQGKMRKLQKHQAFEAEIVANTDRIDKIKQVCLMQFS